MIPKEKAEIGTGGQKGEGMTEEEKAFESEWLDGKEPHVTTEGCSCWQCISESDYKADRFIHDNKTFAADWFNKGLQWGRQDQRKKMEGDSMKATFLCQCGNECEVVFIEGRASSSGGRVSTCECQDCGKRMVRVSHLS